MPEREYSQSINTDIGQYGFLEECSGMGYDFEVEEVRVYGSKKADVMGKTYVNGFVFPGIERITPGYDELDRLKDGSRLAKIEIVEPGEDFDILWQDAGFGFAEENPSLAARTVTLSHDGLKFDEIAEILGPMQTGRNGYF